MWIRGTLINCILTSVIRKEVLSNRFLVSFVFSNKSYLTKPKHSHLKISFRNCICEMEVGKIVEKLNSIAEPSLAADWDNTGLLVEPSSPHEVSRILLTIDLTPIVLQEAIKEKVHMIISYHPPIFAPLKCVTQSSWKGKLIATCLENRIAVFSPHTSWDAMSNGINDWLISAFGNALTLYLNITYVDIF